MITVRYIPNKFAPENYETTVEAGSLRGALKRFIGVYPMHKKPLLGMKISFYVNGKYISKQLWDTYVLKEDDIVEVTHEIRGGVGDFIMQTITLFGLLDFFTPEVPETDEETSDANVYSWEGPSTSTKAGTQIPVVYGTHDVGGTYINFNLWTSGEDNYADMLIALCEGEIAGLRNADDDTDVAIPSTLTAASTADPYIKMNDTNLGDYEEAQWAGRTGTNSQTSIQGFRNVQTVYDYAKPLPAERGNPGGKWTLLYTTNAEVDQFTVKLRCPALYNYNKKGKMQNSQVRYRIRYAPTGTTTWTYDPVVSGSVDNIDSWYLIKDKSRSEVKEYKTVTLAARDQVDLQVQRYNPATTSDDATNECETTHITEIVSEDLAYPNTAIIAIRVKATDQISGTFPNVTFRTRGRKVRVPDLAGDGSKEFEDYYWTGTGYQFRHMSTDALVTWDGSSYVTQYTSNPVYCIRDFMINTRFGLGDLISETDLSDTLLNSAAFDCWQKHDSTTHKSELHIVLAEKSSPADILTQMTKVARLYCYWSGGYIKMKYLQDEDPVQLLTMGNIVEGKFSTTYKKQSATPNIIKVSFANRADGYKVSTREIVDEAEWALNRPQREMTVDLKGITSEAQALREAKYHLNRARYCRRTVSVTTTAESLHCEPGDIVAVQHDVPQWGWGGRVGTSSTSTTCVIDQDVPSAIVSDPTAYDIKVWHAEDDTIETKDIQSVSGKTITISGSWTTTPSEDDSYILGVDGSTIKEYRVTDMSVSEDDKIELKMEEHNASIFSDTGYVASTDEAAELPNPSAFADAVTGLTLYELHNEVGFGVSYRQPEETLNFLRADIYVSTDNVRFTKVGFTKVGEGWGSDDFEYTGLLPGIKYYVKVYSINKVGIKNTDPATANITLTGAAIGPPASPTGIEIDDGGVGQGLTTTFSGRDCKVRWRINAPYGGAGSLEPQEPSGIAAMDWGVVRDFKVEVWNYTGTILIREEYTTDKFYTYTYEKNYADTSGTPRRQFQFKVYQRNWFNLLSERPVVLAVSNPAPDMSTHTPTLRSVYRGATVDFSTYVVTDNDMDYYKLYYGYNSTPLSASVDLISWRNQTYTLGGMLQNTRIYVRLVPYDAFGAGTRSALASVRTDGFDFIDASSNEWTIKADAIVASIIKNNAIASVHLSIEQLSAINAYCGYITGGYIDGCIITGGLIQTASSGKRIQMTSQGISLAVTSDTGGYGDVRYGDNPASNASVFFGSGALAYIHHLSEAVPFYISAEQTVGDFHFYNRSSDPSGYAEIGDVCVVNASLKICTAGGTPGTWTTVGLQT